MTADRDWMVNARCRGEDPAIFFPDRSGFASAKDVAKAASICASCPVAFQCRKYAQELNIPFGIWAGERRPGAHGGGLGGSRPRMPHGTEAAAKRHYRRGEKPCPACAEASARARRLR